MTSEFSQQRNDGRYYLFSLQSYFSAPETFFFPKSFTEAFSSSICIDVREVRVKSMRVFRDIWR